MASGRCQRAGNTFVRVRSGARSAVTRRYRGIDIHCSPDLFLCGDGENFTVNICVQERAIPAI